MRTRNFSAQAPGLPLSKAAACRTFTLEQIQEASENMEGFCLACGESQGGCEPDARKYSCDSCGALQVYGADELAIMGRVV